MESENHPRLIFKYHDGSRFRCADPLELDIKLEEANITSGNLENAMAEIEAINAIEDDKEREKAERAATDKVVKAVRDVFQLAELDCDPQTGEPTGLTDNEALCVLVDYQRYCDGLKKNIASHPTLQKLTDWESEQSEKLSVSEQAKEAIQKAMEQRANMRQSADSTSTEIDSPPVAPVP